MPLSNALLTAAEIIDDDLILADDRTVKLSDFGLAKTERSEPSKGISGTITYMAPELSTGAPPTEASDMYSLGVTLFELTFGRRPFAVTGTTLREQITSHRKAEIAFPEKWPSTVPEQFRSVLSRMLAPAAQDRYRNFDELNAVLDDYAPVGVTPASLLSRAFALAVDYTLLIVLIFPFMALERFAGVSSIPAELRWLSLLVILVPIVATWFESNGWRTLGRYLLQLRLVDNHGLLLGRRKLVWRSLIRNTPIWITAFTVMCVGMNFDTLATLISPVDELIMLIDVIPALGPRRLALHDQLVGSRVVLDARVPDK